MAPDHFPYQLVTFFDRVPETGDEVYQGSRGWFPQVTLKRRFAIHGITEEELLKQLEQLAKDTPAFEIKFEELVRPAHMPVDVVEVAKTPELIAFHKLVFERLGDHISSRYIDRERGNYYPHMTTSWQGKSVVSAGQYAGKTLRVTSFWLLKDTDTKMDSSVSDSKVLASFDLS